MIPLADQRSEKTTKTSASCAWSAPPTSSCCPAATTASAGSASWRPSAPGCGPRRRAARCAGGRSTRWCCSTAQTDFKSRSAYATAMKPATKPTAHLRVRKLAVSLNNIGIPAARARRPDVISGRSQQNMMNARKVREPDRIRQDATTCQGAIQFEGMD